VAPAAAMGRHKRGAPGGQQRGRTAGSGCCCCRAGGGCWVRRGARHRRGTWGAGAAARSLDGLAVARQRRRVRPLLLGTAGLGAGGRERVGGRGAVNIRGGWRRPGATPVGPWVQRRRGWRPLQLQGPRGHAAARSLGVLHRRRSRACSRTGGGRTWPCGRLQVRPRPAPRLGGAAAAHAPVHGPARPSAARSWSYVFACSCEWRGSAFAKEAGA
jgi:hypothetical protein